MSCLDYITDFLRINSMQYSDDSNKEGVAQGKEDHWLSTFHVSGTIQWAFRVLHGVNSEKVSDVI